MAKTKMEEWVHQNKLIQHSAKSVKTFNIDRINKKELTL